MTKKELVILRNQMPTGYRNEVKKRTRYSYSYIDMVFAGTRRNQRIIDVAFEILREYIQKKEEQRRLLDKIRMNSKIVKGIKS